ncbi:MAG: hypothetical protein ACTHNQ_04620 [Microbacterium sp.]|uniref:hypothetical protein n=1 Tax=Microbacterium sp. TaxID=51671 RepID=UPI003F823FEA
MVAIEPSLTMRAVLLARVADDPELIDQVSVLAGAAPDILDELTGPVAGFVCANRLGHLTATGRQETFARLATLLEPGLRDAGLHLVDPDERIGIVRQAEAVA